MSHYLPYAPTAEELERYNYIAGVKITNDYNLTSYDDLIDQAEIYDVTCDYGIYDAKKLRHKLYTAADDSNEVDELNRKIEKLERDNASEIQIYKDALSELSTYFKNSRGYVSTKDKKEIADSIDKLVVYPTDNNADFLENILCGLLK